MKSKFTQADISAARRLYNTWLKLPSTNLNYSATPDPSFHDFLSSETRKGFADSKADYNNSPTKIVRS